MNNYKIIISAALFLAFCFVGSVFDARAQLTNSIFKTCVGTSSPRVSQVGIDKTGNVLINPCFGQVIKVNGVTLSTAGGTAFVLNGLTSFTQNFAVGTADAPGIVSSGSLHTFNFPISGISGTARTGFYPYFTAQNTLGKSFVSQDANAVNFFPANVSTGFNGYLNQTTKEFYISDASAGNYLHFSSGTNNNFSAETPHGVAYLGDADGVGNANWIAVDDRDSQQTITLRSPNPVKVINRLDAGGLKLTLTTPLSSVATCAPGQLNIDANFLYVCTSTNNWKRSALSAF